MVSGIKIRDEVIGTGPIAEKGSSVTIRFDLILNKGEKLKEGQVATFIIGKRWVIAGLEYGVEGMRVGGRRNIRVSPHLGYGVEGVSGIIPANAVLVFNVELLEVKQQASNNDNLPNPPSAGQPDR